MFSEKKNKKIRLQLAVAKLGFSSRRKAAKLIKNGHVKVNNQLIRKPFHRVNLNEDKITVDGQIGKLEEKVYIMLNKPAGVTTTVKDKYADKTVLDLVNYEKNRLYPVGRLDKDSTGLLILTNDGDLTYHLTHPKFQIEKVYQVVVKNIVPRKKIKKIEKGIILDGKLTAPCKIKKLVHKDKITSLEISLIEGRKRQIRKMFNKLGHPVLKIHRIAIGPLKLKNLQMGKWRMIKRKEIKNLNKAF